MPTISRAHGLRFVIFVDDHPPPHTHVSGRGAAKIALHDPFEVLSIHGMSKVDIARARDLIKAERNLFLDAWTRIHGPADRRRL